MSGKKKKVSSGIKDLDRFLGGLFIGDNVLWHDEAGNLANAFCYQFITESIAGKKPVVYVSFDRSPKNLVDKLGELAESQYLTLLDCFTNGKGDGSEVFDKFYERSGARWPYQIIKVNDPVNPDMVAEAVYNLQQTLPGDVRFVFESLTGMQDIWGGEEQIMKFYSHTCPKLYELDTIAYWVLEKNVHSEQLKAYINQIAQVAIGLGTRRSTQELTVFKAERRSMEAVNRPVFFWSDGWSVQFDQKQPRGNRVDLGMKIKTLRRKQGLSQKELAGLAGVTPSTISQVESNSIYPSLPALFNLAEVLSVDAGSLLDKGREDGDGPVFKEGSAIEVDFRNLPKGSFRGWLLTPMDFGSRMEPYLLEIAPSRTLPSHFFVSKSEEMGYMISGSLRVSFESGQEELEPGDTVYLRNEVPLRWSNLRDETARLLWIKAN
jgi:transcriptional regulator with XRE-family HTH domain/KaiC/GvpD/RAD55 family RecA-like ATPase